ncbi:fumarylacetoacetate hydrolase family protein [Brevundimonas sp. SL130]|uniref:fumarylacetoacetate hydrolase family protein n=1 Tax=Brevundimonas sp. SL130 TaxID=2995143 RepID=UPI00226CF850|nr:fumarylacetoacetate hydrolase family protein [Brevundimonas sp. SL130]WAC60771.1 fumarylacetoacetate hydrolase family protein [Brevundimonas sp. SL130]
MSLLFQPQAPVLAPTSTGDDFPVRRILCVGRNYAAHAREMGRDPDREPPFFFTAWAETVVPNGSTIAYPQQTGDFHYEAELVVAIGKSGRDVSVDTAMDHVWGYAAGLDMTRRDLQLAARAQGRPWDTGKNVEQSSPLGLIQKAGEGDFDPTKGSIKLTVNGEVKQDADLADLIWPVADIVAFASSLWRLEPGDLIYTGTPAGVGAVVEGDEMTVTIDGLEPLNIKVGPKAA